MSTNFNIQQLTPRHYLILDYAVGGLTPQQIAEKLSMSVAHVGVILKSPSFQHQFAARRKILEDQQVVSQISEIDEVKQVLQDNAKAAADKLVGGLTSFDDKISLKSAVEILDRTGYPKEQKLTGDIGSKTQIIINSIDMLTLKESLDLDSSSVMTKDEAGQTTDKLT